MRKFSKYCLLTVAMTFALSACDSNDGECRQDKAVGLGVAFFQTTFSSTTESYVASAMSDSMTVYGLDNDSLIANRSYRSSVNLPLRVLDNRSVYVVQRGSSTPDTVIINHQNENTFLSLECGCVVYHTVDNVMTTNHQIDSVTVMTPQVVNTSTTNIRLYYHER